ENLPRNVMRQRELLEYLDGGGWRARRAGAAKYRQLQLVEQHLGQLLRRVDVELPARHFEDRRRPLRELLLDFLRLRRERRRVDPDTCAFDRDQYRDER